MKCPFKLPIKKVVTHVTEAGVKYQVQIVEGKRALAAYLTKDEADYIAQAINDHEGREKLAEACDHAYSFMICVTNLDNEENLKWQENVTEELKQALEAEKE